VLRKTNYYKKHLRLEKLHISDQKTDGDLTRSLKNYFTIFLKNYLIYGNTQINNCFS